MKLEQFEYFLTLYEEHNFTRAARRCGIKQPSLSEAIKRLEADLGGPLFERKGRATVPTELGKAVQPSIVAPALAAEEVRQQAAQFLRDGSLPQPDVQCPADELQIKETRRPREHVMRAAIHSVSVIFALLVLGAVVRSHWTGDTMPPAKTAAITDVYSIEPTIDVKALPHRVVDLGNRP